MTLTFGRAHPAPPDISYLFEVAEDVVSGPWQSGSALTAEMVTHNHDGTETVPVTGNAAVASSPAHFLRIRTSQP